jgi:dihydrolipoamide dehydrogenase
MGAVFDVVVIGGGPGGYVAAVRASQLGLKTALVEKGDLGGTCVNWGCIPTKTLLRNAEVVHCLAEGKTFGVALSGWSAEFAAAFSRSRTVAKRQGKRVEILLKNRGVAVYKGAARLTADGAVAIDGGETIGAGNIIIATGSQPRQLPGVEFDGGMILTAKDALRLDKVPDSAVIVGAGPIGLEFATVWKRFGAEVTVVEAAPRIMPTEDADVSREAEAHYKKASIQVKTAAKVTGVVKTPAGVEVTVAGDRGTEVVVTDKVLVAAGFVPDVAALGIEAVGMATERGCIVVDGQMRTNVAGIYAIGDVTGKLGLAHVASAQGMIAAEAIAGHDPQPLVYENIPRCIFGWIEVASVGLTESQAKERGHDAAVAVSPFVPNGKAVAMGENAGFVKLVADRATGKLLGAHMIGPHVTELVAIPTTVLAFGGTVAQMARQVYAHPTLSEAVLEGAHLLAGHAIHL